MSTNLLGFWGAHKYTPFLSPSSEPSRIYRTDRQMESDVSALLLIKVRLLSAVVWRWQEELPNTVPQSQADLPTWSQAHLDSHQPPHVCSPTAELLSQRMGTECLLAVSS